MLIEICCKCGFVHRDDRLLGPYTAYKPHYHWMPATGELQQGGFTLHATVCAACVSDTHTVEWKEFFEYKATTPAKYRVQGSLNAPLPERYIASASELYALQATYFQFE